METIISDDPQRDVADTLKRAARLLTEYSQDDVLTGSTALICGLDRLREAAKDLERAISTAAFREGYRKGTAQVEEEHAQQRRDMGHDD